jgi:hypothetical protein
MGIGWRLGIKVQPPRYEGQAERSDGRGELGHANARQCLKTTVINRTQLLHPSLFGCSIPPEIGCRHDRRSSSLLLPMPKRLGLAPSPLACCPPDIEGAATQVVHRHEALLLVAAVSQRRRCGLVDNAQHIKARDAAWRRRVSPGSVVCVRRHCGWEIPWGACCAAPTMHTHASG